VDSPRRFNTDLITTCRPQALDLLAIIGFTQWWHLRFRSAAMRIAILMCGLAASHKDCTVRLDFRCETGAPWIGLWRSRLLADRAWSVPFLFEVSATDSLIYVAGCCCDGCSCVACVGIPAGPLGFPRTLSTLWRANGNAVTAREGLPRECPDIGESEKKNAVELKTPSRPHLGPVTRLCSSIFVRNV